MNELKVTRNYSFWKHPIKWWKDRKAIKFMNIWVNHEWEHGMREEVEKATIDMFLYGRAVFKGKKRVDPNNL